MVCEDKFLFSIDLKFNKIRVLFSIWYLKSDNYLVWYLFYIYVGVVNDCMILGF